MRDYYLQAINEMIAESDLDVVHFVYQFLSIQTHKKRMQDGQPAGD